MIRNRAKWGSPEQEYYQQGLQYGIKTDGSHSKNGKVGNDVDKKMNWFQFRSQKILNTVPNSPRKLFKGEYKLVNAKKGSFSLKSRNSNSTSKSNDSLKVATSNGLQIHKQTIVKSVELKYQLPVKLPPNLVKPNLPIFRQTLTKNNKINRRTLDKFIREYATTVGVINPQTPRQKFMRRRNQEKKTIYRTESLAQLSYKFKSKGNIQAKKDPDNSNKDSNPAESTASHESERKKFRRFKSHQSRTHTLRLSSRIQNYKNWLENDRQIEQGYLLIQQVMQKIKRLALHSQGIVENYEQLDEWEELIFLVYKKYYLSRKKLLQGLKQRDVKYFQSFMEMGSQNANKINKFMIFGDINKVIQKVQQENKGILESLRNLYNLAIEKSGVFINMNENDNFDKQIFKLLSEEVQSLESLFDGHQEEVTMRLKKNIECAKTLCQINGMKELKIFKNLSRRCDKKTVFWKILKYYGTLL